MKVQLDKQVELFSEAELESLEFVPEELEAIEGERVPDLDSISFEEVAQDLEAFFKGGIEEARLESRGGRNKQARRGRGFYRKVNTQFQWNNVPDQVRRKVNEIVLTQAPAQNQARFTNGTIHSYWRAGDYRIFGNLTPPNGFRFVGYGIHQGSTNNKYTVTLPGGGTTTARN